VSKIGALRDLLFALLQEHERDSTIPTNARFLFYELVQRGELNKERKGARRPDQDLHDALTDLREQTRIPWDWIVDETRSLDSYTGHATIRQSVLDQLRWITLDPWAASRAPLVLTESRSLAGVLRSVASEYRVRIAATNGQCGGFLRTEIAPRLQPDDRIIYLGDLDLSGGQIEANTRRVLEQASRSLDWERLALTPEQVREHDLPVIVKHDHRYKDGRAHEAVETEAISQRVLVDILRARLDELLPEPLPRVCERERRQRTAVSRLLNSVR
jgi:hypothetical protein